MVGSSAFTVVEQIGQITWFCTLGGTWLGAVPGNEGLLDTQINRSAVTGAGRVWEPVDDQRLGLKTMMTAVYAVTVDSERSPAKDGESVVRRGDSSVGMLWTVKG